MKKIHYVSSHIYAPELNRFHMAERGISIPCKGATTNKEARDMLFPKLVRSGKYATIKYINHENPQLNREYSGFCANGYKSIQVVMRALRKRHSMPGGRFAVSINYLGK